MGNPTGTLRRGHIGATRLAPAPHGPDAARFRAARRRPLLAGWLGGGVILSALALGDGAMAQDVSPSAAAAGTDRTAQTGPSLTTNTTTAGDASGNGATAANQDIVVTGTLLRGKAPVGSNLISLGQQRIDEVGATSANELLASIPQVTNYFNRVPSADLAIAPNQFQVSRPNIRNISPNNAAESATLVLVDGHRIATAGIKQSSVDPDVIPTGAIERVEVLTEGGSATYGTDAVAGVINFITRRRFDGVAMDARYGFSDNYWQTNASVTAGKDWGSGSAYISYTFTKNDAIYGRDRGFIRRLDYSKQPYVGLFLNCQPPTVSIASGFGNTVYGATCDETDGKSIVPKVERHGVLASLYQDLDSTTSIDIKAYYSRRQTDSYETLGASANVTPNNPYYALPAGVVAAGQTEAVGFDFAPLFGRSADHTRTLLQEWGVNAELKKEIDGNWQLRTLFNYSRSNTALNQATVNTSRLNGYASSSDPANAFDPFDLRRTNPAVIADVLDNEIAGEAKDDLVDIRPIVEGRLFRLPGGDVRLAVGYEFMHDSFATRYQSDIRMGALEGFPFTNYDRSVNSVFGELQLPIVGADNAMRGIQSLIVTASGRWDHYSDFGSTTNPKVGAAYKPVDWLTIRGNWGTSFTAPSPLDQLGALTNQIAAFPFTVFVRPGDTPRANLYTVGILGSNPGLKPQTATTWSVGFDASPPIVPGLRASLNYYNVVFKDIISTPVVNAQILSNFPANFTTDPNGLTAAQLRGFESQASNGAAVLEPLIQGDRSQVYQVVDFRVSNFGVLRTSGLDFNLNYRRPTSFGEVDLGVNGNYTLRIKSQYSPTSPVVDVLASDNSRLLLQTTLGATIGKLRAQAQWNHNSGFAFVPGNTVPAQSRVGAFDTVDLFFKYDLDTRGGVFRNLSLTLNVNNVADQNPPVLRRNLPADFGYANGFTLGRLFMFGIAKKF